MFVWQSDVAVLVRGREVGRAGLFNQLPLAGYREHCPQPRGAPAVFPFSFLRQGLWVAQAGLFALACPVLGSQASAATLSFARVRGKDVWLVTCVLKSFLFLLDSVVMDNRDALPFQC